MLYVVVGGNNVSSFVGWIVVILLVTIFSIIALESLFERKDIKILKKSLPDRWTIDAVKDGYALARNKESVVSVWKINRNRKVAEIEMIMPYIGDADYTILSVGQYNDNINVYVTDGEKTFLYVLDSIPDIANIKGEPKRIDRRRLI